MRSLLFIISIFLLACGQVFSQGGAGCPQITLVGPAGETRPGDTVTFTVDVKDADVSKYKFKWYVTFGKILSGNDSPHIEVATERIHDRQNLTATVEIEGLPAGCPNTASETAGVSCGGGTPMTIDEYGRMSLGEEKAKLRYIAGKWKATERVDRIVFVFYRQGKKDKISVKKRAAAISKYLAGLRIPRGKVDFIYSESKPYRVKIYFVPEEC
jgi:hypothetical protein